MRGILLFIVKWLFAVQGVAIPFRNSSVMTFGAQYQICLFSDYCFKATSGIMLNIWENLEFYFIVVFSSFPYKIGGVSIKGI